MAILQHGCKPMIFNDPVQDIITAAKNIYGDIDVLIQYDPRIRRRLFFGPCGYTFFPDNGGSPVICISTHISIVAIVETLAHELAHAVTGYSSGHGEKWERAFELIHAEYNRINLDRGCT